MVDAVRHSLGSGLTSAPIDRKRAVMALRAAQGPSEHEAILAVVLAARARHRAWITTTQRQWQDHARTVTPRRIAHRRAQWGDRHTPERIAAVLRESVETRERYVRCGA